MSSRFAGLSGIGAGDSVESPASFFWLKLLGLTIFSNNGYNKKDQKNKKTENETEVSYIRKQKIRFVVVMTTAPEKAIDLAGDRLLFQDSSHYSAPS